MHFTLQGKRNVNEMKCWTLKYKCISGILFVEAQQIGH